MQELPAGRSWTAYCVCGVGRFAQSVSGSTQPCMLVSLECGLLLCGRCHQDYSPHCHRERAASLSLRLLSVIFGLFRSWSPESGGRCLITTGWSFPCRRWTFSEQESGCSSGPQRNSSSSTSSTASAAGEGQIKKKVICLICLKKKASV